MTLENAIDYSSLLCGGGSSDYFETGLIVKSKYLKPSSTLLLGTEFFFNSLQLYTADYL